MIVESAIDCQNGAPGGHALPDEADPVVGRDRRARRRSITEARDATLNFH